MGMNVKKVLYEKVIVPTVTYGSELWGMKEKERKKLNVFEMRCLRSMCGVSRWDRIRNEVVRERTGVRKELADGVKKALNGRMSIREAKERARNRNEWRRMVLRM